jgi:signal transduction histidine kinase/CheY-like chemotaxis protein
MIVAAGHPTVAGNFFPTVLSWCLGDLTGVLTIAPLCYVHLAPRLLGVKTGLERNSSGRVPEIVAQGAALVLCLGIVAATDYANVHQAYYLTFVPLVWICLRHGLPGATIASLLLTMGVLVSLQITGASAIAINDLLFFEMSVLCIGLGLGTTVTRRWKAEHERARLLAILEATPDLIGTMGLDGRLLYRNHALLRLRGPGQSTKSSSESLADALPAWAAEKVLHEGFPAAIAHGHWQAETAFLDAQAREKPVSQVLIAHYNREGQPTMISTIARDISAEKEAEKARLEAERSLLQTQKLESLGVLAGGIAHDFNNLLTVVLGNASLARLDVPEHGPADGAIHQIELAAIRAADLCRQMLAYAGKGRVVAEMLDLTRVIEETTDLLKVSISKNCVLDFVWARDLPPVKGDPTQLNQIAVNLIMNASDACGEKEGRISVRTGLVQADRAYLASTYLAPTLEPGPYVYLEVSDNGSGMNESVVSRIFEPFFTTKFSGHGLGLSAVLGIARSHNGAIKVDSTPGRGTTIRLLLPAATGVVSPFSDGPPPPLAWRGTGRVLVVDDENAVRETAAHILERSGFTTVRAIHGQEAVDIFQREPLSFSAVLLDLTMPVMNGEEAFRRIRELNASIPVVMMSGYNRTDSAARFAVEDIAGFVQKPFRAENLVEALRLAVKTTA